MSADCPVFLTCVRSEYLYDHKEGFDYFTPATVFAVSSHTNETIKMSLIADDSVMFANIPVCALANSKTAPKLNEDDCVYDICSDNDVVVIQYEYLATIEHCCVWKKDNTFWQKGVYLFTVEWSKTKQQLHFIELEDGNYIFCRNEKITWGEDILKELPRYGK